MKYIKYQHIERLVEDNPEINGILDGTVYIFPKLDGTNAQCYLNDNGELKVGSRNRALTLTEDNQGCMAYVVSQPKFEQYLRKHPNHRLVGEYLIKNSIKDYEDDAWKKLYIFDVIEEDEEGNARYLSYEEYVPLLEEFNILYIPLITKLDHPTYEEVMSHVDDCTYLMKDNKVGEGIICKNYSYHNVYGRVTWAKVVRSAFKIAHKAKLPMDVDSIEEKITNDLCTPELIEKEYNKILNDNGGKWDSKCIPRFLGIFWHTFITEECFNMIRKYKEPKIDFRILHKFVIDKIKTVKHELF